MRTRSSTEILSASFRDIRSKKGHVIRWSPVLCKSCEVCVAFCPADVLSLDDSLKVYPSHPDACTGCRLCEYLCPDFAVEVDRAAR